jgi:hypothetical protein
MFGAIQITALQRFRRASSTTENRPIENRPVRWRGDEIRAAPNPWDAHAATLLARTKGVNVIRLTA